MSWTRALLGRITSVEMRNAVGGVVANVPLFIPLGTRDVAVPSAPGGNLRLRFGER